MSAPTVVIDGVTYEPIDRRGAAPAGPRIGVGVTTRNRPEVYTKALAAWKEHLPAGAVLVVVDDATDVPYVRPAEHITTIARFGERAGVARAKNRCLELLTETDAEHLFLVDDDTWPTSPDWWRPYVDSPEPHLMRIFGYPGGPTPLAVTDRLVAWPHPCGCFLYVHRSVLDVVGGMDLAYGPWGHEHLDWSNRIHNAGLTTWRFADVVGAENLIHCEDEVGTHRSTTRAERQRQVKVNEARYETNLRSSAYHEYRTQRDIVLTHWAHGPDHQRGNAVSKTTCADTAAALRASVTGADLVLLGDDDTADERVPSIGMSIYQSRWVHYYRWLREHPEIRYAWLVDAGDVTMLRPPWDGMRPGLLYVGWEPTITDIPWMRDNHPSTRIRSFIAEHADAQLLNCGLIGGDRTTVLEMLRDLIRLYEDHARDRWKGVDKGALGNDMGPVNYVLRQPKWDGRIVATSKVCTLFKQFDTKNPYAWWCHK